MHSLLYDQGSLAKVTVMQFQVLQVFEPPSSLAKKGSEITIGQLIITILQFTRYIPHVWLSQSLRNPPKKGHEA